MEVRLVILANEAMQLLRCKKTKIYVDFGLIQELYPTSAKLKGRVLVKDFCDYFNLPEAQVQASLNSIS